MACLLRGIGFFRDMVHYLGRMCVELGGCADDSVQVWGHRAQVIMMIAGVLPLLQPEREPAVASSLGSSIQIQGRKRGETSCTVG